jgi:hypothetical protein
MLCAVLAAIAIASAAASGARAANCDSGPTVTSLVLAAGTDGLTAYQGSRQMRKPALHKASGSRRLPGHRHQ